MNMPVTVGLSGKTSINMAEFSSGKGKTGNITKNYLLILQAVGLEVILTTYRSTIDPWAMIGQVLGFLTFIVA